MIHHRVAGLVLAAGASSRLGQPKQLLTDSSGTPAVVRIARALQLAGCSEVFVVTGAESERVMAALQDDTVHLVSHDGWRAGMGSSIAAGVRALQTHETETTTADGVLIAPCDMPTVGVTHLHALLRRFDGHERVASSYLDATGDEVIGIPAVLPRRDFAWLQTLDGDRGARPLFREAGTRTVPLSQGAFDLDTPADLDRWRQTHLNPVPPMSTLQHTALMDLDQEFASTRRMLERLPEDRLDFTPHPKSWTLGTLATHLLDPPLWAQITCASTELNFDAPMPPKATPTLAADFVRIWDERVAECKATLARMTDDDLQVTWQATAGGHVVMSMPRIAVLRSMVLNHMIHHRAQLSMYYRLLDVPLPGMYGPSADEK